MSPKQKPLLTKNGIETSPDAIKKVFGSVTRALTALKKAAAADPAQAFAARKKVVAGLRDLDGKLDDWIAGLDAEQAEHARQRAAALDRRREDLARAAQEAGWTVLRRQDHDVVDCFRVEYRNERVTVRLGSERLEAFDEADGKRVVSRLRAARERLEDFPFDRSAFFQALKDAVRFALTLQRDRDGRVPIRKLYPLVVLARQGRNERFLKKPDSTTCGDYPMTQFVYDFARFGRGGWKTERGERISNQPPNMATIARRASVTLPVLDGRGAGGAQLGSVWIERSRSA